MALILLFILGFCAGHSIWNDAVMSSLVMVVATCTKDILCRYTGQLDQVCTDSCLEFFFSPTADGRYLNLEANPKGTLYLGLRYDRNRYVRFVRDDLQNVLQIKPFTTEDGWGIEATFCVDFLQLFYPDIRLTSGMEMKANFYKCGNDTPMPHYLTWNTVETPQPDYHQPAYFGKLILK